MAKLPLTTISICLLMAVAESQSFTIQTEHKQINVTVGETANFSVKPSAAVKSGNWDFRGTNIGLWIASSASISNYYRLRAEILTPNGSLLLKSVMFSDSGEYTVTMVPEVGEQASAILTLHVLAESQSFTIQTEHKQINVTVGETANFSVKPSAAVKNGNWDFQGTNIGLWIASSASISNDYRLRAEILTPNGSLLLKSVMFSDSGEYTVTMVPEVGEQASATLTLHVLAESQSFTIQTEHKQINVTVGETANFSVKPSAAVKNGNWDFQGTNIGLWIASSASISNDYRLRAEILTPNGSLLLKSVMFSDSGEYTVTMVPEVGEQASATLTLHVLDHKTNVGVTVGIVIASLVFLGFIGGISVWLIKIKSHRMKSATQGQHTSSRECDHAAPFRKNSSTIYENIPRKQKEKAMEPSDENVYTGLQMQDRSVYSELKRNVE
ncbi:uncharacterized protein [Chiloscyllium punctatum]|uniref:uncharacterized protein isoform X3 n=1 Tax=Chiloscyllium punctatum TaxID=137246 RepID=UPI003B640EF2